MPRLTRPRLPRPRASRLSGWLSEAGRAADRVGLAAGRLPGALEGGARAFWFNLSISTRRRLALALGILAAAALVAFVAVPALPCGAPGGEVCPPADEAIRLVPDDAVAYLHLNVDPDTEQFADLGKVAARMPLIAEQAVERLLAQLPGPHGRQPDFARDIEPWFEGEAALAVVPAGATTAEEVQLLEASDKDDAEAFADAIASGRTRTSTYRDIDVQVDRRGLATALVGGFLAIGRRSGVREAIDAKGGAEGTGPLAKDEAAQAVRDALPDERLADAYLSEDGIARFVASPRGALATVAPAVSPGASTGIAAALVTGDEGLELSVRSNLDPARARAHPGFFAAFPRFVPTLAALLPRDSLGYVGIGEPQKTLQALLEQASAEEAGPASAVANLTRRARKLGDVNPTQDLLPTLGTEAAFALEPSPSDTGGKHKGGKRAGVAVPISATPFLEFVGAGVDAKRATEALARLEAPIAEALKPGRSAQAPVFSDHRIGHVSAHSLRLSPTVNLTYAVAGALLVIATDPVGVEQVAAGEGGLKGVDLFEEATNGLSVDVSVLGYLNLRGLVALGEAAGLAEDPAYVTFAPEIRSLKALGLAVRSSADELAIDLRLIVGEPGGGTEPAVSPSD